MSQTEVQLVKGLNLDPAAPADATNVDSSGRFLVGTSSAPSNKNSVTPTLAVSGSGVNGAAQIVRHTSVGGGGALLELSATRGTSATDYTILQSGDGIGTVDFLGADGNEYVVAANILAQVDGTPGDNDMPGRLVFSTTADAASSPTERMRINRLGNVNIGSTADNADTRLYVKGQTNDSTQYATVIQNSVGANLMYIRNDAHFFCDSIYNQTTASGANVHIDGAARLLRSTSSLKYKTNVETLEDNYADAILNVRPVWYQSLGANDNPDWGWWGFIAEEVAEIDPRLVSWKATEVVEDENGSPLEQPLETPEPEGVYYDRFVPHLLNLIKRQKEQIEAMEARLSALEAQ